MSKAKVLAQGDHIIIEVVPKKVETNLVLPETSTRGDEDNAKFIVYSVGEKVKSCKPGDRVVFNFKKMMNVTEVLGECGIYPNDPKNGHFITTEDAAIICVVTGGE